MQLITQIPTLAAGTINLGLNQPPGAPATIGELVSNALGVVMSLLLILFVGLVVYGGYTYMMSTGDPGKVKQAQSIITNAIIGLIIVAMAFVIREVITRAIGVTP
jgi:TRAP-type C4-dicarboxylate transport system permease small subunit